MACSCPDPDSRSAFNVTVWAPATAGRSADNVTNWVASPVVGLAIAVSGADW